MSLCVTAGHCSGPGSSAQPVQLGEDGTEGVPVWYQNWNLQLLQWLQVICCYSTERDTTDVEQQLHNLAVTLGKNMVEGCTATLCSDPAVFEVVALKTGTKSRTRSVTSSQWPSSKQLPCHKSDNMAITHGVEFEFQWLLQESRKAQYKNQSIYHSPRHNSSCLRALGSGFLKV